MRILNLGILAHADAGKTTLSEQMLYHCGQVSTPGRVDHGNTHTDYLAFERQRGISARACAITLPLAVDIRLNLFDTPGHVDFIHEVETTLAALDVAVLVVSAVEGLQGQSRVLYRILRDMGVPVVVFLNKTDRVGSRAEEICAQMQALWGLPVVRMNCLQGEGSRALAATAWEKEAFLEELGRYSDEAAEAYLLGESLSAAAQKEILCRGILQRQCLCVVQGAALSGVGVPALLQLLGTVAQPQAQAMEPPLGYVFQVRQESGMGAVALVRMFRGQLRNRDSVCVQGRADMAKILQIRTVARKNQRDLGSVAAGEIAAVYGLGRVKTGDVLGEGSLPRTCSLTTTVLRAQVLPAQAEDLPKLAAALEELCLEDPALQATFLPNQKQLHVSICGKLQLELLQALLQERYCLQVSFAPPQVIYRETVRQSNTGFASYTMPKPCWAVVTLQLEPLPRGSGVVLESVAEDRNILRRYQNHVLQCLPTALQQGLFGWEVTDVKITLVDGQHHLIHTHPLDFFVATPMALMDGLTRCGVQLLEPMLWMRLSGPQAALPRVTGELLLMRAELKQSEREGEAFVLTARVPVATAMDFPARFAALTQGQGQLEQRFDGYAEAPEGTVAEAPRIGVDPRDRSKWILACRNAL